MKIKRTIGERLFDGANMLLMVVLIIFTLYPLLHVLNASLSDSGRLMAHSGLLFFPEGFNLDSYKLVLSNPSILSGYRNTIVIVVLGTALNLLFTILGAYTLSRKISCSGIRLCWPLCSRCSSTAGLFQLTC